MKAGRHALALELVVEPDDTIRMIGYDEDRHWRKEVTAPFRDRNTIPNLANQLLRAWQQEGIGALMPKEA